MQHPSTSMGVDGTGDNQRYRKLEKIGGVLCVKVVIICLVEMTASDGTVIVMACKVTNIHGR